MVLIGYVLKSDALNVPSTEYDTIENVHTHILFDGDTVV